MGKRFEFPAEGLAHTPTSADVFLNRRQILKAAAAVPLLSLASACRVQAADAAAAVQPPFPWPAGTTIATPSGFPLPGSQPQKTTAITVSGTHNNFYEFLPGRGGYVYPYTAEYQPRPWQVEVTGECHTPRTFDLDALYKLGLEERLYAFRCVERWAMNVPWVGVPFARLLDAVAPTSHAKFVRFVCAERPDQMPGIVASRGEYPWPYHEALRIDEAMNPLALLATGMYGQPLLKQNGAPVRMILPWKYGYKGPKAIVRIELVREQPPTFWGSGPYKHEYGFLSNVNPNVPHPRWSQAKSYWLGSDPQETFPTPIFNGYGKYVAHLYPNEPRTPQAPLRRGQMAR